MRAGLGDELLAELIKARQRALRIAWPCINFQHILHGADERCVVLRRQAPLFGVPGL